MSWTVPTFWIRHLLDMLREQDLSDGVEIVEGHNLDHYFLHTKREILVMDEWPEYIVIRGHVANHGQSENHMRFFDDEDSARSYMETVMANNYTTNKYTLVFKGPVPSHLQNAEMVVVTGLSMGINEVTWLEDDEAVGAMDSLDYIDPKHPLLQNKSEDDGDYDDVLEEAEDFLSDVGKVLEYLKPQNCVAIIIESLFTCSRPRPLEHGCYVQAAKLVNGEVKTFGVGGPNVLDMIGD